MAQERDKCWPHGILLTLLTLQLMLAVVSPVLSPVLAAYSKSAVSPFTLLSLFLSN